MSKLLYVQLVFQDSGIIRINTIWFTKSANQRLKDQFIQKWTSYIDITSQSNTYRIFKTSFQQSAYIATLPNKLCQTLLKFRTRNNRLPIETGRWRSVPINERLCPTCSTEIDDKIHFLFTCPQFQNDMMKYLLPYFYKRPNILKFEQLMNSKNKRQLRNLCNFIRVITEKINW